MRAVPGAPGAHALIIILKFIAALNAGSPGLLAESPHSRADTTNQVFPLPGTRFYKRPASEKHLFGYGTERFFRSFIAAISSSALALSLLRGESAATPEVVYCSDFIVAAFILHRLVLCFSHRLTWNI